MVAKKNSPETRLENELEECIPVLGEDVSLSPPEMGTHDGSHSPSMRHSAVLLMCPWTTWNTRLESDDSSKGLADILFLQGLVLALPVPLTQSNYSPNSAVERALFLFPPILQLNPQAKNFFLRHCSCTVA